jgi:hypothetical protein
MNLLILLGHRRWIQGSTCVLVAISMLPFIGGCANTEKWFSASGKVVVGEQPANGLYVVFHSAAATPDGQGSFSARTDKTGTYSVQVREPGEYLVTVFWPMVTVEDNETLEGDDAFGGRYRDPKRPVTKVTIREREHSLPPIKIAAPE